MFMKIQKMNKIKFHVLPLVLLFALFGSCVEDVTESTKEPTRYASSEINSYSDLFDMFWNTMNQKYNYFNEQKGMDWEAVYKEYAPKFKELKTWNRETEYSKAEISEDCEKAEEYFTDIIDPIIDYISNPDIQARRDSIGDVGYEGNINYELLLSLDPDLVLLYGVNGASAMESKLEELDIPFMYVGDYLEESPLGKAEWMVVLSEVTGKREKGEKAFAAIPVRYNALKKKVADSTLGTPSVMLNVPYGDSWFMPSTQSYVARLITDAGGRYIYQKNTGNASIPIDLEEAYLLASDADMWLNVGMANSLDDLKASCPKFTDTRCFKNGEVYNNNARTNTAGGNDYYESAVVNPDIVLRDLVKIFHPELVQEECVYYKQLK